MHGGACTKNGKTRASIGLQPFFAFEALIVMYSPPNGGRLPPFTPPLALRAVPPTRGENTLLSSLRGICTRIFKGKFICCGG